MKYRIRVAQPVRSKLIDPDLRSPEYIVQQKDGILGWKKVLFTYRPVGTPFPEWEWGWDYAFRFVEGIARSKSAFSSFEEAQEYVNVLLRQDAEKRYKKPVTLKTYRL